MLFTAEDALGAVVRPRLQAAGADLDRVHLVENHIDGLAVGAYLDEATVEEIGRLVDQRGVRLVVIDPLVAFIPAGVDTHRDQTVRRVLAPLARLAERADVSILAIAHLKKSEASNLLGNVGGSVGFVNAARSVLLFGPDPDDAEGDTRVLVHVKSNWSPLAGALRFRIEAANAEGIETSVVHLVGDAGGISGWDVVQAQRGEKELMPRDRAKAFLLEHLTAGPAPGGETESIAASVGINPRTLRRAREALGVIVAQEHDASGRITGTTWRLPSSSPDGQAAPSGQAQPRA
jgi:hypothetical protein